MTCEGKGEWENLCVRTGLGVVLASERPWANDRVPAAYETTRM